MKTLKMKEILFGDGDQPEGAVIYIIRDGRTIFYIGMSTWNCADRVCDHYGLGLPYAKTTVGNYIRANEPQSMKWSVQFWTPADCAKFLKVDLPKENDIKELARWCESKMISALRPACNNIGNTNRSSVPKKYRRRLEAARDANPAELMIDYGE